MGAVADVGNERRYQRGGIAGADVLRDIASTVE